MYEYLSIGPTPVEEKCEQLGPHYDPAKAKRECRIFAEQLARQFGEPPEGASLVIKSNPHDFGTYYEVNVKYEEGNEAAMTYAFNIENNTPATWDEAAQRAFLTVPGFTVGDLLRSR